MSRTPVYSTHSNSRLVKLLCDLLGADGGITHQRFIAKLSKLIDISGASELSSCLGVSVKSESNTKVQDLYKVSELFVGAREEILTFIVQSFAFNGRYDQPFYLPLPSDNEFSHDDNGLSAYQRFYRLHQSEMEIRVARLLKKVRQNISVHSPALARLAVMDATLNTVFGAYCRNAFAAVPQLLAQRFRSLFSSRFDVDEPLIRSQFIEEMRQVLLAELDIRLKPALGLVESAVSAGQAVNEEEKIL